MKRLPPLWLSCVPLVILVALISVVVSIFGDETLSGASQISLIVATAVCVSIGLLRKITTWTDFEKALSDKIGGVSGGIIILLLIGALGGSWMVGGIVPTLIYYGMQIMSPQWFLVSACVICALVSVITGSSWTTIATIGIARDLLGLKDANSTEFDEKTKDPVIFMMGEQTDIEDKGATMRLGAQPVDIKEGSFAAKLYDATKISERHRHRYEVNPAYIDRFENVGWKFTGRSDNGRRMEIGELVDHPFFVASQFHPEFKSEPMKPTPLHLGLVKAALEYKKSL